MPITLSRSLLVILIPGGVAVLPWIIFALKATDSFNAGSFYREYTIPINAVFVAFVVIVGALFEGFNTHQEVKWDRERETEFDVQKNWYDYLSYEFSAEPVGFSYLARLATTMYFEMAMMWCGALFFLGLFSLLIIIESTSVDYWPCISIILGVLFVLYFRWQARCSHEALCVTRRELNARWAANKALQRTNP